MLKRTLFACLLAPLALAAAQADTTPPMLSGMKECASPPTRIDSEAKVGFTVSESGVISDMHIITSSGDADTDQKVMRCVSAFTFRPATRDGVAVAAPHVFSYHSARLQDLKGEPHAFADLEHDADRRCHKLYPIDRRFFDTTHPISLVVVSRQEPGKVQMGIVQSAGEKADRNAMRCLQDLLSDHDDLPAQFARTFSIDWTHR